jgi:hypothetical protein
MGILGVESLIQVGANKQLAYLGLNFLSSSYLFVSIVVFGMAALLFPRLFPSLLGGIWRGIVKIEFWWRW